MFASTVARVPHTSLLTHGRNLLCRMRSRGATVCTTRRPSALAGILIFSFFRAKEESARREPMAAGHSAAGQHAAQGADVAPKARGFPQGLHFRRARETPPPTSAMQRFFRLKKHSDLPWGSQTRPPVSAALEREEQQVCGPGRNRAGIVQVDTLQVTCSVPLGPVWMEIHHWESNLNPISKHGLSCDIQTTCDTARSCYHILQRNHFQTPEHSWLWLDWD